MNQADFYPDSHNILNLFLKYNVIVIINFVKWQGHTKGQTANVLPYKYKKTYKHTHTYITYLYNYIHT